MAFRDSLSAAQARIKALEQHIEELGRQAAQTSTLERDNRRLRAALARARSDYMPTAARMLNVGAIGAGILALYLFGKLGLSLVGTDVHLPPVTMIAFSGILVGMFALSQLGFGTTAPAALMAGVFGLNQLALLSPGIEMMAIAHTAWLSMIALAAYIVLRAPHLPRGLAGITALVLALAGLAHLAIAISWQQLVQLAQHSERIAAGVLPLFANGLLTLYLTSIVLVGACLFAARNGLLQTAPTPPEVPAT